MTEQNGKVKMCNLIRRLISASFIIIIFLIVFKSEAVKGLERFLIIIEPRVLRQRWHTPKASIIL